MGPIPRVTLTPALTSTPTPVLIDLTPVEVSPRPATPTPSSTPRAGESQLCIRKFADLNGNGTHDSGEPWLSRWTLSPEPLAAGPRPR